MPPYYGLALSPYSGSKNKDGTFTFEKVDFSLPSSKDTETNVQNLYQELNGKFLISSTKDKITISPGKDNLYYFYWIGEFDKHYNFWIGNETDGVAQFTFVVSKGRPIFARSDNTEVINQKQNNLFDDIYSFPRNIAGGREYFITKALQAYVVFQFQFNGNIERIFTNWGDYISQRAG
jgi:hypothetical protein